MEWMIDTANLSEIEEALRVFPVEGVTTNPSILKAEMPIRYEERLLAIRRLAGGRTMHVQLGGGSCAEMLDEAEALRALLGGDVYLKVPVTEPGLETIRALKKRGFNVTATAIYYALQGMLAVSAGADYLAPYCNRMEQNGIDYELAIGQIRGMIDRDGYASKILAASFKNAGQVTRAIDSGAHAVTVQPALLKSVLRSALVTDAVRVFNEHQALVKGE